MLASNKMTGEKVAIKY